MANEQHQSLLVQRTRELLLSRPRNMTYAHIEEATGISWRWVAALASDDQETDFGVIRVEKLYTFLSGKAIEL